tara:strand:- start:307 stop:534 length:228 start_codon:yes stop_codon:yes gene_type:complete
MGKPKNMTPEQEVAWKEKQREQKAYLIQQRSNSVRTVGDVSPWRLTGDSLIVRTSSGEVRFPRSQLAAFVAQLTK